MAPHLSLTKALSQAPFSKMSSRLAPTPTLSEDLASGMLRGVRVDRALGRFGAHWSLGSKVATPEEEFALSEPVPRLDDFLTHDWGTSGWLKFLALCVIYNSWAATVASVIVAVVCGILATRHVAILPRAKANTSHLDIGGQRFHVEEGIWCLVLCPLVFLAVLFFWQRIRSIALRRPRYAFVDKLCINQSDEGLKRQGICSLAGFLRHSDRLVVLWSPSYFTRLWCAFEVAAWIRRGEDQRPMHFMPVKLGIALLLMNFAAFSVFALSRLIVVVSGVRTSVWVSAVVFLLAACLVARRLADDLSELPRQLGGFSVASAKCFCCEHSHVHPATGARLPCDRELIYDTIAEWFVHGGARSGHASEALEAFEQHVHTRFKDIVVASVGTVRLGYRQALVFSVPVAWQAGDALSGWCDYPPGAGVRELVGYACTWLCVGPCLGKIMLGSVTLQGKLCAGRTRSRTARALSNLAVGLTIFAAAAFLALPVAQSLKYRRATAQACLTAVELLLTVALYAPDCWRPRRPAGPERAPELRDEAPAEEDVN